MNELIATLTFAIGVPLLVAGYIMSIIAVKRMKPAWKFGMVLGFPLALPFFALIHWPRARKPFTYSTIGIMLIMFTLLSIPDQ